MPWAWALRLYDLTDQPLDFHPTRQLRSAIVARGMYYQMLPDADPMPCASGRSLIGQSAGQYEPPILENLVARHLPADGRRESCGSRACYTTLFWLIAGLAVFDLARRMTGCGGGAGRPGLLS